MRTLILSALLFLATLSYSQTYYCVQVCSTPNPHLLKPEMVSVLPDTAMIEFTTINGKRHARILFCYLTEEEQSVAHTSWLKQWHDAMRVTRTSEQVRKMQPLFTSVKN